MRKISVLLLESPFALFESKATKRIPRGREDVRNLTLGYPSLKNRNSLGEIHKVNPEILGYPRIPGSPLTHSLLLCLPMLVYACLSMPVYA